MSAKFTFKKATKEQSRLRMAIHGPSGAGKTYTALSIATNLGKRVLLADTEEGSASKYADKFDFDVFDEWGGDYNPDKLVKFLQDGADAGYDVIVVDSCSHFWNGAGGFLELVDQEVIRQKARSGGKGDTFSAWKVVDPVYKRLIHAILNCKADVIITLRAKTEYSKEDGKVKKLGMSPEMRNSFEYEMDVEGMLDIDHKLTIGKTRCDAIDGRVFAKPGKELADALRTWLSSGAPATEKKAAPDVVDELIAKLGAASSLDEIESLKKECVSKREQFGSRAQHVREALTDATARVAP